MSVSGSESTRIAFAQGKEVHLKKNEEVSKAIASDVAELPTSENWVVLDFDITIMEWTNAEIFSTFVPADEEFVDRAISGGLNNAARLNTGGPRNEGNSGGGGPPGGGN